MAENVSIAGRSFEVRRSNRAKRLAVGYDLYGKYFLRCPQSFVLDDIPQSFIDQAERFVANTADRADSAPAPKEYRDGETFMFRGKPYPLFLSSVPDAPALELGNGRFTMDADLRGSGYKVFEMWYKRRLYHDLRTLLPRYTKIMGVRPERVRIRTVKSLWGSCSSKGSLTFCTRLALVPPPLLEYTVVHELAHFREMNHSSAFWAIVGEFIPDYTERRRKLKDNSFKYRWW